MPELLDEPLERDTLTLRDNLDGAVRHVLHVSDKPEPARVTRGEVAIHNHLHPAGNDTMNLVHVHPEGFEPPTLSV